MKCYTCKRHHVTVQECRDCYTKANSHVARHVVNTEAPPTVAQLSYVTSLGGDSSKAVRMTRAGVSGYIEGLKAVKAAATKEKRMTAPAKRRDLIPAGMLEMVPSGYYAVQASPVEPFTFLRVVRPTKGQWAGHTKVQTQHSDTLKLRFVVYPDGRQARMANAVVNGRPIDFYVKLLLSTHRVAAIAYGREIESCCLCGRTLTDPRSKHYCVGPECEKKYAELAEPIMAEAEEVYGPYVPFAHV